MALNGTGQSSWAGFVAFITCVGCSAGWLGRTATPTAPWIWERGAVRLQADHWKEFKAKVDRQSPCSAPSHWLLEQKWVCLLFSRCSLLCRCCLLSWLHDFGTGTSENTSGCFHCHSGQEGTIPFVFTQQNCLDLLPTSVVLKLIYGSASTQHWIWTPGLFHAVTLAASSVQGFF